MSSITTPNYTQINQMFQCYSICTLALWFKYLFVQTRGSNFQNHPQEDAEKLPASLQIVPEDIKRRERAFLNDVENIPFDLVVFWAAFLVQVFAFLSGSEGDEALALIVLFSVYCFSRFFYTMCYYFGWQPYRTILFMLAKTCAVGAASVLIAAAFKMNAANLNLKNFSTA